MNVPAIEHKGQWGSQVALIFHTTDCPLAGDGSGPTWAATTYTRSVVREVC